MTTAAITFTMNLPVELIHNAIIGALEGGSNYWLRDASLVSGFRKPEDKLVWWGHREVFEQRFEVVIRFDDPEDSEGTGAGSRTLTNEDLTRAASLMASKSPSHFADLLSESDDAETHDVFMQYLVLDDIIYS